MEFISYQTAVLLCPLTRATPTLCELAASDFSLYDKNTPSYTLFHKLEKSTGNGPHNGHRGIVNF